MNDRFLQRILMGLSSILLVFSVIIAEGQTITGTVRSSIDNQPLVGVTVSISHSHKGTITDDNGKYQLRGVSPSDTIIYSFIGYENETKIVGGNSQLDVFLEATPTSLDRLVVVGYGTQKRKNVLGAVSQKDIGDITNRSTSGIARDLQGAIPGLNIKSRTGSQGADPGSPMDINIRGFTSINGGSPLVLVDGIEESLYYVNPNNVESISVLKGAEAAAIYGARGAYGVILVQTKKAKAGTFKVEYSNNIGSSRTIQRTDFITNPYKYGRLVDAAIQARSTENAYTQWTTDEMWEDAKKVGNGELEPFMKQMDDGTYRFFYNTDWWRVLHRKWQNQQTHNLAVSGGSETLNARVAARYFKMTKLANIHDANVLRYNLDMNVNYTPYKWLELTFGGRFTNNQEERIGGNKNGYASQWSVSAFRDKFAFYPAFVDGIPTDIGRSHNGYTGRLGALVAKANWRKYNHKNYVTRIGTKITPLKNLEINFNFNYNWNNYDRPTRATPFETLVGNELRLETMGQSNYTEYRDNTFYKTFNGYGSYSLNIGNDNRHHFKIMLGFNQEESHMDHIEARMNDLLSPRISNLSVGTEMFDIDGSTTDWGLLGYFGRFNYNYANKYLIELNARYDASSRFPKENRWGFFPSFGAGWRINNENFWKNSSINGIISSLKIRGSYGSLGNQTVPVSTFLPLLGLGKSDWLVDGSRVNYARIPSPLPSNIDWEKVTSTSIGLDFGLFEDKLTGKFDWFQRETSDMYLPGEPLPAVFGASEPRINFASLRNRGFEFELGYSSSFNVLGSPLRINVSANVSNFKAVITKFNNPDGLLNSFYKGQRLGTIWGYHVSGLFGTDKEAAAYEDKFSDPSPSANLDVVYHEYFKSNGEWGHLRAGDPKFIDINGDGKVDDGNNTLDNHGDLKKIGNASPQFPFGFSIEGNWRGFDIEIIGQGIAHQDWYPLNQMYWGTFSRPYAAYLRKDLYKHVWNPDLTPEENRKSGNRFPQIYRSYGAYQMDLRMNDFYMENLGYFRLQNLTIGYTLPPKMTKKVKIQKARLFFSGENIWTIRFSKLTKYIDPEVAGAHFSYSDPNAATDQGNVDYFYYPKFMTFSGGIQLEF